MTSPRSSSQSKARRKYLAVQPKVAEEIFKLAKGKGMTLFSYVSEVLRQAAESERSGFSLKEAIEAYRAVRLLRELNFTPAPSHILAAALSSMEAGDVESEFKSIGVLCGKYLSMKYPNMPAEDLLKSAIQSVLWGLSDLSITSLSENLSITFVASTRERNYVNAVSSFIEGLGESLGYYTASKEVVAGLATLTLRR